jgi:hypothetical protein
MGMCGNRLCLEEGGIRKGLNCNLCAGALLNIGRLALLLVDWFPAAADPPTSLHA